MVDPCFFWPLREMLNLCLRIHPHDGDYHFYAVDDAEALVQEVPEETTPQAYTPPRLFRVVPLLIGAVIVLGAALLVTGIALTLAKRRR